MKKSYRISNKKTDWKKYQAILKLREEDILTELDGIQNYVKKYDYLCNIMRNLTWEVSDSSNREYANSNYQDDGKNSGNKEKVIVPKSFNGNISSIENRAKNLVEWWDAQCNKARADRKECLLKVRKNPSEDNIKRYKQACQSTKKLLKDKKKTNFRNFIKSINGFSNIKYIWKKATVLKNSFNKVKWNSWQTKSRKETILKEIDKLSLPWVSNQLNQRKNKVDDKYEYLEKDITIAELNRSIGDSKAKNTSPGKDGIEYNMIAFLTDNIKKKLCEILNDFWSKSYIPDSWRQYLVIFIDKVNKEKVRPISLSSCMCKILEKIINYRFSWWLENNQILDKSQMGFRKGKGCLENLTKLVIDLKKKLLKNKNTTVALLDVTSAYDNVEYNVMIKRLDETRCPNKNRNFIANWLLYRNIEFVVDNDHTIIRTVGKGLPQGAVFSPNLYSVYTADISKNIEKKT